MLKQQLKTLFSIILPAYLATLAILLGAGLWAKATDRRVWFFTVEPFLIGNLPAYAGILSTLGNILWAAAAAVCFYTAWILKIDNSKRRWKDFLFAAALLTVLLMTDGLFQMHRIFYPRILGVPTIFVFGFYGLYMIGLLGYFREQVLETEYLILGLALIFFFLAVVFDMISILPRGSTAFSDGLKLFGIVSWLIYFVRTSRQALMGADKENIKNRGPLVPFGH
jgi:hypothetical protein